MNEKAVDYRPHVLFEDLALISDCVSTHLERCLERSKVGITQLRRGDGSRLPVCRRLENETKRRISVVFNWQDRELKPSVETQGSAEAAQHEVCYSVQGMNSVRAG